MKKLIYFSILTLIFFSCKDEQLEAYKVQEGKLDAQIEQLQLDIELLSETIEIKRQELKQVEQKLDSVTKALLEKR